MILGISGKAGAGKDCLADILVVRYGLVKVALADPMKRFCKEVFDFSDDQLWGQSKKRGAPDWRYLKHPAYVSPVTATSPDGEVAKGIAYTPDEYLTPRFALQELGTQWGRSCFKDVWIAYALRVAGSLAFGFHAYDQGVGLCRRPTPLSRGTVIPDIRFANELHAIKAAGGKIVRLKRATAGLSGTAGQHASEAEQDTLSDSEFDAVFDNDGTIDDLAAFAARFMEESK